MSKTAEEILAKIKKMVGDEAIECVERLKKFHNQAYQGGLVTDLFSIEARYALTQQILVEISLMELE